MKKTTKKVIAVALCAAVCGGFATAAVPQKALETAPLQTELQAPAKNSKSGKTTKDETVYVLASADGNVEKIIVSDWIQNGPQNKTVKDWSDLKDPKGVKGDVSYTLGGDNFKVWDADGEDVYYQGEADKELPVQLEVSYQLDGQKISAEDLAGKGGRVTIRYNYKNKQKKTVSVNGKSEEMYVPFVMITGMILDTDVFQNVQVTNGKLVNDGNHMAVVGMALPGLQENLKLDDEDLIPDYFEITADVKDFEMGTTMTIASNSVFSSMDSSDLNSISDLTSAADKMSDAMNQLLDGSGKLYEGLSTLLEESGVLVQGIDQLMNGAAQLNEGTKALKNGTETLTAGVSDLNNGLETLASKNSALTDGAYRVFCTLLKTADEKLAESGLKVPQLTPDNYVQVLDQIIASLDKDKLYEKVLQTVTAAVEQKRGEIEKVVEAAAKDQVLEQVVQTALKMSADQYKQLVENKMIDEATQQKVNAAVQHQLQKLVDAAVQQKITETMESEEIQNQLNAAGEGAKAVIELKTALDSYQAFYSGLLAYTQGVSSASAGAKQLQQGAIALQSGAEELYHGTDTLMQGVTQMHEKAPALIDGITALKNGSGQLSDGLAQFSKEGIEKLVDVLQNKLGGSTERLQATIEASKSYNNYSSISDDMGGQVKFIYRTSEIEKLVENK